MAGQTAFARALRRDAGTSAFARCATAGKRGWGLGAGSQCVPATAQRSISSMVLSECCMISRRIARRFGRRSTGIRCARRATMTRRTKPRPSTRPKGSQSGWPIRLATSPSSSRSAVLSIRLRPSVPHSTSRRHCGTQERRLGVGSVRDTVAEQRRVHGPDAPRDAHTERRTGGAVSRRRARSGRRTAGEQPRYGHFHNLHRHPRQHRNDGRDWPRRPADAPISTATRSIPRSAAPSTTPG